VNSSILIKTLNNLQTSSVENTSNLGSQFVGLKRDLLDSLHDIRDELLQSKTTGLSRVGPLVMSLFATKDSVNTTSNSILVLRKLWFSGMESRELAIREAHPQSCQRAFTEKIGPWCSSIDPIFWLSGKPGSGKSTMMKFLTEYKGTSRALQTWTGSRRLIIASHYFWVGGTKVQKSQEGLLRSILFDILQQEPDLTTIALPTHCDEFELRETSETLRDLLAPQSLHMWRPSQLKEAFRNLTTVEHSKVSYCIFIDGLDEFEGDKDDLIDIVKSLASMPNVKICIASRPWNVFESAFGSSLPNKLYLQDFNEGGIRKYVQDNLESLDDFQLLISEQVQASKITQQIVYDAHGVFLWVFLVVRSLREGIRNFDRLTDLQNRLREFPKDLDAFFRQMFDSMEPIYRKSAARTFQIALTVDEPLSLLDYWWADVEETDPEFLSKLPKSAVGEPILRQRVVTMTKRINGRMKGLLEARPSAKRILGDKVEPLEVDFLHRTVRDFLMTKEMTEILKEHMTSTFDPWLVICLTRLADLKSNPYWRFSYLNLKAYFREFYSLAGQFEIRHGCSTYHLLQELDSVVHYLVNNQEFPILEFSNTSDVFIGSEVVIVWTHAVAWGLKLAVTDWLRENGHKRSHARRSHMLYTAATHSHGIRGGSVIPMMKCIWDATPATLNAMQMKNLPFVPGAVLKLILENGTSISDFTPAQRAELAKFEENYDVPTPFIKTDIETRRWYPNSGSKDIIHNHVQ
jgi:hypothetical protein